MRYALLLIAFGVCCASDAPQLTFDSYPVTSIYQGKRAKPILKADEREYPGYRAVLGDSTQPPNFAGRYVISQDICGSDSVRLMITDARTGKVFDRIPCFFWTYVVGPNARTDLPHGVEFRLDSSLLIAHGCFDSDNPKCGNHFYKMTPRGLVSISRRAFNPPIAH